MHASQPQAYTPGVDMQIMQHDLRSLWPGDDPHVAPLSVLLREIVTQLQIQRRSTGTARMRSVALLQLLASMSPAFAASWQALFSSPALAPRSMQDLHSQFKLLVGSSSGVLSPLVPDPEGSSDVLVQVDHYMLLTAIQSTQGAARVVPQLGWLQHVEAVTIATSPYAHMQPALLAGTYPPFPQQQQVQHAASGNGGLYMVPALPLASGAPPSPAASTPDAWPTGPSSLVPASLHHPAQPASTQAPAPRSANIALAVTTPHGNGAVPGAADAHTQKLPASAAMPPPQAKPPPQQLQSAVSGATATAVNEASAAADAAPVAACTKEEQAAEQHWPRLAPASAPQVWAHAASVAILAPAAPHPTPAAAPSPTATAAVPAMHSLPAEPPLPLQQAIVVSKPKVVGPVTLPELMASAPLYHTMLAVQDVHGAACGGRPSPAGLLRCAAALQLASSWWSGPVGPRSMSAEQLALALAEENLGWADWCRDRGLEHLAPSEQVRALLEGAIGFNILAPQGCLQLVIELDLPALRHAAAAARDRMQRSSIHASANGAPPGSVYQPLLGYITPAAAAAAVEPHAAVKGDEGLGGDGAGSGRQKLAQLVARLAEAAFPGDDTNSQLIRVIIGMLGAQMYGAHGKFAMGASALGNTLAQRERVLYHLAPLAANGNRLNRLVAMIPCVTRVPLPPSDSLLRLDMQALKRLAASRGARLGAVSARTNATSNSTEPLGQLASPTHSGGGSGGGSGGEGAAEGGAEPGAFNAADGTWAAAGQVPRLGRWLKPAKLRHLADQLYPREEPFRDLKLHVIGVLAETRAGVRLAGHMVYANNSMLGPQFGEAFKAQLEALPAHVARPRMAHLAANDPFLVMFSVPGNMGIRLQVRHLLLSAAKKGLLALTLAAAATRLPLEEAPLPPKPSAPLPPRPPNAEQLCAMAEQLLPKTTTHRQLKLQAVRTLAMLADPELSTDSASWLFTRVGPQFGSAMKIAQPKLWNMLGNQKLRALEDPAICLHLEQDGALQAITLNATALQRAHAAAQQQPGVSGGDVQQGRSESVAAVALSAKASGNKGTREESADGSAEVEVVQCEARASSAGVGPVGSKTTVTAMAVAAEGAEDDDLMQMLMG